MREKIYNKILNFSKISVIPKYFIIYKVKNKIQIKVNPVGI